MCTLAVAAACGSSSSGPDITVGQIAQHYDQIASNYLNGSASPHQIGEVVAGFNGGPANGVIPGGPQVTNTSFQHGWLGNVINLVDSARTDSLQFVFFWFGGNVEAILAIVMQNGNFVGAAAADSGSSYLQDSVGTGTISLSSTPGTCAFTQITNVSTPPTFDPAGSTCSTIAGTFAADSLLFPQADSSLTAFIFARPRVISQRFTGVRLQYNSESSFNSAVAHVLSRRR